MTLAQAWDWLASFTNLEKNLSSAKRTWRLDRMHALLGERGHPEASRLTWHLAGSKGKGSTAAYLSSILTATGRTTGLYVSPHVADWRERITLNGQFFPEEVYARTLDGLRSYWEGKEPPQKAKWILDWGGEPTTFEWLTLAAFEVFREQDLDAQVLETGLGGRLDATNAQTPTASLLTLIELEHTDILGDTLALIAAEKAGILKPGVPAWCAPQKLESLDVFRNTAKKLRVPFHSFDEEVEEFETELTREGTFLRLGLSDGASFEAQLPLLGQAQGLNAAVAAWALHGLVREGLLKVQDNFHEAVRAGLEATTLPGRMQILSRNPWVILDGAHTAESAKLLAKSWEQLFGVGGTLVFGAFEGKAVEPMAVVLAPLFQRVIVTPPSDFRPSNPEALRQVFLGVCDESQTVEIASDPNAAMAWAESFSQPVLACGSFYLVGEILKSRRLNSPG